MGYLLASPRATAVGWHSGLAAASLHRLAALPPAWQPVLSPVPAPDTALTEIPACGV